MRRNETQFASPPTQAAASHMGALVRQARLARRWTLAELAERARVSPATLKRIEKGAPSASLGSWLALFERLGLLPQIEAIRDATSEALLDATRAQRSRRKTSASDLDF